MKNVSVLVLFICGLALALFTTLVIEKPNLETNSYLLGTPELPFMIDVPKGWGYKEISDRHVISQGANRVEFFKAPQETGRNIVSIAADLYFGQPDTGEIITYCIELECIVQIEQEEFYYVTVRGHFEEVLLKLVYTKHLR